MNHFINVNVTDLSLARSVSLINPTTPKPFPVLAYGDSITHQFFFHDNGTIESWSGNVSNGLRVTLGDVNRGPSGGAFTLTSGETTPALLFSATAGDIESALNALPTVIADGEVDVTGTFPNFLVLYRTVGAKTAITAAAGSLTPASGITVTTLTTGDGTNVQQSSLTFRLNAIDSTTTWTPISSPYAGWTGTLTTNTAAALALLLEQGETIGSYTQVTTIITVERIQPGGAYQALYQASVIIRAKNSDLGATPATPFPTIASPIMLSSKSVTVGIAGSPADVATISIPSAFSRWRVIGSTGINSPSGLVAETAAGTLASAAFEAWSAAGGTGTQVLSSATGPTAAGALSAWPAVAANNIFTGSSIFVRQTSNSLNAGTVSFYVFVVPLI